MNWVKERHSNIQNTSNIVLSVCSLRGSMIPATFLCRSYAGYLFPRFLRHFVSTLWAFVLINSIALLKIIMRDPGGSLSIEMRGGPLKCRWFYSDPSAYTGPRGWPEHHVEIMRELCGNYAGLQSYIFYRSPRHVHLESNRIHTNSGRAYSNL